jgi:multidrug efflux pump subunit AcrA (membrane-fusion protein)
MQLKVIGVVAAAIGLAGGGIFVGSRLGDDPAPDELLIVPRQVERRTLSDVLTINGEVRRDETQELNLPVDGKVSAIAVEDGDTVNPGDELFALDGRTSVAVDGEFAFFRRLDVGSDGPDVLQLETILSAAGYEITEVDRLFTEETRSALASWQLDRGYGGATPEPIETITVGISPNSAGYSVGKANTVAFTVEPAVPLPAPAAAPRDAVQPRPAAQPILRTVPPVVKPTIEVTADLSEVAEGGSVTFTFTASPAPATDLTVDLTIGGDATGGDDAEDGDDYAEIETSFVFPAAATTYTLAVPVYLDNVIEDREEITVSLTDQFGNDPNYVVGPRNQARVDIPRNGDDLLPVLTLEANTETASEGQTVTFTIETTVESNRELDVSVQLGGSMRSGLDYVELDLDDIAIPAGATQTQVQVQIKSDDRVEGDESIEMRLIPDPQGDPADPPYAVGTPASARIVISSDDLPELTISGGGPIAEGGFGVFTITADAPVTADTSINYQLGGTAQAGIDFETLAGTVIMKAGTKSVAVPIKTIDDDVVFLPSDMIVASWPARIGKVLVDDGEFVLQGSPVITLTEPVFTITLQVSASDRSELVIGQEVEVSLAGGTIDLPGVIATLDDSATIDEAGGESYEGTVEVTGDFEGVDGAKVTIDVTLQQADNVLAVPVASVLRTATGNEVRVVNDQGTITRVAVEIGLIDGEWIEIVSGLTGNELVVIDVDPGVEPPADE